MGHCFPPNRTSASDPLTATSSPCAKAADGITVTMTATASTPRGAASILSLKTLSEVIERNVQIAVRRIANFGGGQCSLYVIPAILLVLVVIPYHQTLVKTSV